MKSIEFYTSGDGRRIDNPFFQNEDTEQEPITNAKTQNRLWSTTFNDNFIGKI